MLVIPISTYLQPTTRSAVSHQIPASTASDTGMLGMLGGLAWLQFSGFHPPASTNTNRVHLLASTLTSSLPTSISRLRTAMRDSCRWTQAIGSLLEKTRHFPPASPFSTLARAACQSSPWPQKTLAAQPKCFVSPVYETLRQRYQKHAQSVARKSPKLIPRFYLMFFSSFYYDFISSHLLPLPAASASLRRPSCSPP